MQVGIGIGLPFGGPAGGPSLPPAPDLVSPQWICIDLLPGAGSYLILRVFVSWAVDPGGLTSIAVSTNGLLGAPALTPGTISELSPGSWRQDFTLSCDPAACPGGYQYDVTAAGVTAGGTGPSDLATSPGSPLCPV